jgi:hypothetical protein
MVLMPWPFTPGGAFGPDKPLQRDANDDGTFGPSTFKPPTFDTLGTFKKMQTMTQAASRAGWTAQNAGLQGQLDTARNQFNRVGYAADTQIRNLANRQSRGTFLNAQQTFGIEQQDAAARSRFADEQLGRYIRQAGADTRYNVDQINFVRQLLQNQLGGYGTDRAEAGRVFTENVRNLGFDASARGASRSLGLTQDTETQQSILDETLDRIGRRETETRVGAEREEGGLMKQIDDLRRNVESEQAGTRESKRQLDVGTALKRIGLNNDYIDYLTGVARNRIEQNAASLGIKLSEKDLKSEQNQLLFKMFENQFAANQEANQRALEFTRSAQQSFIEKARNDWLERQASLGGKPEGTTEMAPGANFSGGGTPSRFGGNY